MIDEDGGGRPFSERVRHHRRTLEAYFKAGSIPRWMERVSEVDQGIARERRRFSERYRALKGEYGHDHEAFARRWEAIAAGGALRRPQRADPAAQQLVSDRARPPDGHADARLREGQRQVVPPCPSSGRRGCSSTSRRDDLGPGRAHRAARPRNAVGGARAALRRLRRHDRGGLGALAGRHPRARVRGGGARRPCRGDPAAAAARRAGAADGLRRGRRRAGRRPRRSGRSARPPCSSRRWITAAWPTSSAP